MLKKISIISIITAIISIVLILSSNLLLGESKVLNQFSAILFILSLLGYILSAMARGAKEALSSMKKPTIEQLHSQYYLKNKKIDRIYDWIAVISTILFWGPLIIYSLHGGLNADIGILVIPMLYIFLQFFIALLRQFHKYFIPKDIV